MPQRLVLFLAGLVFLLSYNLAGAQVLFNEIAWKGMTTGATHEWLELFNSSSSSEDISGWVISDDTAQLNIVIPDGSTIAGGGYYVIKRNTSTVTPFNLSATFNGGLIDSGERLVLNDESGVEIDEIDFLSGWPDSGMTAENTMQRDGSSWITATPTPSTTNQTSSNSNNNSNSELEEENNSNNEDNSSSTANSYQNTSNNSKPEPEVEIIAPKVAFLGIPFELKAETNRIGGRYFWNFGDGNSNESKESKSFQYTYFYEGEYVVSVEYSPKNSSSKFETEAIRTIKVVPMDVFISKVGDVEDFFIEIANNTGYEIDVSGWALKSYTKNFIFPRNSVILPKKKLTLSSKVTNFNFSDKNGLKLENDTGHLVDSYASVMPVYKAVVKTSAPKIEFTGNALPLQEIPVTEILEPDLSAAVLSTDVLSTNESKNVYTYIAIFVIFMLGGATSVYFIRKRGNLSKNSNEFELID